MTQPKTPLAQLFERNMTRKEFLGWGAIVVASIFGLGGIVKMLMSHAATPAAALEPETGTATAPATVVNDTTASGGKAIKFGAVVDPPPTGGGTYHPMVISSATQLPHAPKDANYVSWNTLGVTYLEQAFKKLGSNDILVLPERAAPYEIDSTRGFVNDATHFYSMCLAQRGLVGLGPGVIVQTSASSFRSGQVSFGNGGNQNRIVQCENAGAYWGNFEMRGRDFGGVQYDGIDCNGNNAVWERIFFNGAHRGFKAAPDGECGALSGYKGSNQQVYNVEVDCRDPATGRPVGTSPFMFNVQSNVTVVDFYGHHAYAGMPTFWTVTNIITTRLRSEFNGNGPLGIGGAGINHEIVAGTVTHNNPTLIMGTSNPDAAHISIGTDSTNANYFINNPTFDASWDGPNTLTVDIWPYPKGISQTDAGIHVVGAAYKIHH
jgi:hypothetical protein